MVCILQHVPLQERLTACALVCLAWAEAAVAAPAIIEWKPTFSKPQQFEQLRDWLRNRGDAVVSFTAMRADSSWSGSRPLQPPVAKLKQLRSLDLENVKVQLVGVAKRRRGAPLTGASAVPQLQELRLSRCQLSVQLSSHLLSAEALKKLHWEHVTPYTDNTDPVIAHPGWDTQRQIQGLPILWHHLQLLQQLPKLSELKLAGYLPIAAGIARLGSFQHLQRFSLTLQTYSETLHEPCARALLAALQHLTQLQDLELSLCGLCTIESQAPEFSALTASTQLTALSVTDGILAPIPQAAYGTMFPSRHVRPNLQVLRIESMSGSRSHCVDEAQVARIAAGCPALQQLTLLDVTPQGFDVSCLLQLPLGVTRVEGLGWTRPAP